MGEYKDFEYQVKFTLSRKMLLEEGYIDEPGDFMDFCKFVEDREQDYFGEEGTMLSEYAEEFYYKKTKGMLKND